MSLHIYKMMFLQEIIDRYQTTGFYTYSNLPYNAVQLALTQYEQDVSYLLLYLVRTGRIDATVLF